MGDDYVWGVNPVQDLLFQIMMSIEDDLDLSDPQVNEGVENSLIVLLTSMGVDPMDVHEYLDFKFKKIGRGYIKALPNNIVTAMWFVGAMPKDCEMVYLHNTAVYSGHEYKFNKKTKKLTWKPIKK